MPTSVNGRVILPFCEGFLFTKIKPLQKFPNLQYLIVIEFYTRAYLRISIRVHAYNSAPPVEFLKLLTLIFGRKNCTLGNFSYFVVVCWFFFFKINFFEKNLSGVPSDCQTDWIQIRPDILSSLIWVQSVCKVYQQIALSRQWVNCVSWKLVLALWMPPPPPNPNNLESVFDKMPQVRHCCIMNMLSYFQSYPPRQGGLYRSCSGYRWPNCQ